MLPIKKELKAEIATLKSLQSATGGTIDSPPAISTPPPPEDSTAIAQQLVSYQTFMEQYMVNAQNQKLQAVREAELKAEKKFQERLENLLAASKAALKESSVDATVLSRDATLFDKRNARIVAAANAGVSRWGSMEVDKAKEQSKSAPLASETAPSVSQSTDGSSLFDQRNAKVIAAADAGKSRWGSAEVDRAKSSGVFTTAATSPQGAAGATLFELRNARVVAAADAGKSRWGSKEVEKAGGSSVKPPSPTPTPVLASLEDRVNLGAKLLSVSTPVAHTSATAAVQTTSLFDQRNAMVVAAANAGKSRWGSKEVQRAMSNGVPSNVASKSSAVNASLFDQRNAMVVAAADAGKSRWGSMEVNRAKKSSSGTSRESSLEERVNLGAQLISA